MDFIRNSIVAALQPSGGIFLREPEGSTNYTTEAIKFQADTKFADEVRDVFVKLREIDNPVTSEFVELGIAAVVKKYTNLTIKPVLFDDVNAYAMITDLNRTNPLIYDQIKEYFDNGNAKRFIRRKGFASMGIDLVNGRVWGDLAEVPHEIGMGSAFRDFGFTPEEEAAIFLHEIGHIMTQYEMVFRLTRTNWILQEYSERIANTNDKTKRMVIVREIEEVTGQPVYGKEFLAGADSANSVSVVLLNSEIQNNREELGIDFYSMRGTEVLADRYVSRLGYHVHLASGLTRLYKEFDIMIGKDSSLVASLFMQGLAILIVTVFTLGMFLLLVLLSGPAGANNEIYDDPVKRIQVIRKDAINRLKETTKPEAKRRLVKEIEQIDSFTERYKDFDLTIFRLGWNIISSTARQGFSSSRLQKALEHLAANELNVAAEKLLA